MASHSTPSANSARTLPVYEEPEQARLRAWVQLARTSDLMIHRISAMLSAYDITMPQFDVLATLRYSEGVTQQELAGRLLVSKGNVCQVLDRLAKFGWVERSPDPDDAHINRLHLTTAGRKKIGMLLPRHDALVLNMMKGLSATDVKSLCRLLNAWEAGIATK